MSARTTWIAADAAKLRTIVKDKQGNSLQFAIGTTLRLRLGLFENAALDALSGFTAVTVEVKPVGATESTVAIIQKNLSSGDINSGLTLAQWNALSASHLDVTFASGEMNNLSAQTYLLCVWGIEGSTKKTWFSQPFDAIQDGCGETTVAPPPVDSYYTAAQVDTLLGSYVLRSRGDVNVRDYGATGDGVTNDKASIQAAEDYAAANGLHLFFPAGTYLVNGYIAKKSGVKWRGTGKIKADISVTNHFPLVYAENADSWEIVGLSFENLYPRTKVTVNSAASNFNACVSIKNCDNWRVEACVFRVFEIAIFFSDCKRFFIRGNDIDAGLGKTLESLEDRTIVYIPGPSHGGIISDSQTGLDTPTSEDGVITDNVVIATGLDIGISICIQAWGETPIIVANNHVRGSRAGIQVYTGTLGDPGTATTFQRRAIIQGNHVEDTWETGIYIRSVWGVLCTGNIVVRAHLNNDLDESGYPYGGIVTRVSGYEFPITSPVSLEVGHVITNNMVIDTGAVDQGGMTGIQVRIEGCTVKGNVIKQSAERYGASSYKLVSGIYVASNVVRFDIAENTIQNAVYGINVSRISYANSDTKLQRISGNLIEDVAAGIVLANGYLIGCTIQGNTVCDFTAVGIRIRLTQNTVIKDNILRDGSGSAIGIQIAGGTFNTDFRGFPYTRVGPTNIIVGNIIDNVTTSHAIEETIEGVDGSFPGRCLAWEDYVNGQRVGKNYRDTLFTSYRYTWFRGEVVWKTSTSASGKIAQVCVTSGTHGTITAGTVADTTIGSATITMTSASAVAVNSYITIAGVTGTKKVIAINGDAVTLDSTCDATVAGAAVAFSAPVFKDWGAIDA